MVYSAKVSNRMQKSKYANLQTWDVKSEAIWVNEETLEAPGEGPMGHQSQTGELL